MQSLVPLSAHKVAFLSIWNNPAPMPITVADMDRDDSFSLLDGPIEAVRTGNCWSVEFYDDNFKHGGRALEFDVRYVAGHEWDEDGCSPRIEKAIVWVMVTPRTTIDMIVRSLMGEINALTES